MTSKEELGTSELARVFAEEIAIAGGTVQETYDDGSLLISRALLPRTAVLAHDDVVAGGAALRADRSLHHLDVRVRPYIHRRVCRNGAIVAQSGEAREFQASARSRDQAITELRGAIHLCVEPQAFARTADAMAASRAARADETLQLLPLLVRLRADERRLAHAEILIRFLQGGDPSRFGLVNAVTSLARDTGDPARRWRLEELGGAMILASRPTPVRSGAVSREPTAGASSRA